MVDLARTRLIAATGDIPTNRLVVESPLRRTSFRIPRRTVRADFGRRAVGTGGSPTHRCGLTAAGSGSRRRLRHRRPGRRSRGPEPAVRDFSNGNTAPPRPSPPFPRPWRFRRWCKRRTLRRRNSSRERCGHSASPVDRPSRAPWRWDRPVPAGWRRQTMREIGDADRRCLLCRPSPGLHRQSGRAVAQRRTNFFDDWNKDTIL